MEPHTLRVIKALGQAIREKCTSLGITKKQLAEKTGLRPKTISRYETGNIGPTLLKVVRLSSALEVLPSALMGRVDEILRL